MNELFNYDKIIQQLSIKEHLSQYRKKLDELLVQIHNLEYIISSKKQYILTTTQEYKNISNRFLLLFNKNGKRILKRKKELKDAIRQKEFELNEAEKTIESLNEEVEKLKSIIQKLSSQLNMELGNEIQLNDGVLTITDAKRTSKIPKDSSKKIIVHCTDFFPKNKTIVNNYEGNKPFTIPIKYNDVTKMVKVISHRHSVHFATNGVVEATGDGMGSWDQKKYIIIEPLAPHKDQFICTSINDAWVYGSMALTGKPILLVRADAYDSIPQEEIGNYFVIKYDGNYVKCLNNVLSILGVKKYDLEPNDVSHSVSLEMGVERSSNARHAITNYMKNNSWDGKTNITFNEQELFHMYELVNINSIKTLLSPYGLSKYFNNNVYLAISEFAKELNIDENFINFIMSFGIIKTGDNYSFMNDDDLHDSVKKMVDELKDIKDVNAKREKFKTFYDFGFIKKLYDRYVQYKKKNSDTKSETSSFDPDMTCKELYKFENQEVAQVFFSELKKKNIEEPDINVSLTTFGCHIKFIVLSSEYDYDKLLRMGLSSVCKYEKVHDGIYTDIEEDIVAENAIDLFNKIVEFKKHVETAKLSNSIGNSDVVKK